MTRPHVCPPHHKPPIPTLSLSPTNEKNAPLKIWGRKKRRRRERSTSLIPAQIKFLNARFLGSQSVVSGLFLRLEFGACGTGITLNCCTSPAWIKLSFRKDLQSSKAYSRMPPLGPYCCLSRKDDHNVKSEQKC